MCVKRTTEEEAVRTLETLHDAWLRDGTGLEDCEAQGKRLWNYMTGVAPWSPTQK